MKKKNAKKIKLNVGYDEFFKTSMKVYFEPFATVITDFEIIKFVNEVDEAEAKHTLERKEY